MQLPVGKELTGCTKHTSNVTSSRQLKLAVRSVRLTDLVALGPVPHGGVAVPAVLGAAGAHDTLVHSRLDAVVLLDVQLGESVVVEHRRLADVTEGGSIHDVPVRTTGLHEQRRHKLVRQRQSGGCSGRSSVRKTIRLGNNREFTLKRYAFQEGVPHSRTDPHFTNLLMPGEQSRDIESDETYLLARSLSWKSQENITHMTSYLGSTRRKTRKKGSEGLRSFLFSNHNHVYYV